ncbi:hypothetical protein [Nonomuraea glycinis]|uniref:hypothetical protein n=1 Tax=Nonomuraea glycinis TaxID=2047744 RepID=UPI00339EFFF9
MTTPSETHLSTTPPLLRAAADLLAALPHARVLPSDVHHALRRSTPEYGAAQAALEQYDTFLQANGAGNWLRCWAAPRSRDEVATELRAAADTTQAKR